MEHRHRFSLVELLTVIAIIIVLAGILIPMLANSRRKAKYTRGIAYQKDLARDPACLVHYNFELGEQPTSSTRLRNVAAGDPSVLTFDPTVYDGTRTTGGGTEWVKDGGRWPWKNALEFTGGDLVECGNWSITKADGVSATDQMTIMSWFRPTDFSISDARLISKTGGNSDANHDWLLAMSGDQGIQGWVRTTGTLQKLDYSGGQLQSGRWYHAAFTYDGNYMRLYLDGVEVASVNKSTDGTIDISTRDISIGDNPGGSAGKDFHGFIDELVVLNRAMSDAEIAAAYKNGLP